jgi:hypothetical protein
VPPVRQSCPKFARKATQLAASAQGSERKPGTIHDSALVTSVLAPVRPRADGGRFRYPHAGENTRIYIVDSGASKAIGFSDRVLDGYDGTGFGEHTDVVTKHRAF